MKGALAIGHQPTKTMVVDGLTKLASADVMHNLRKAMGGEFPPIELAPTPTVSAAFPTSVDSGPRNRSDNAGDGPVTGETDGISITWNNLCGLIYQQRSLYNVQRLPFMLDKCSGREKQLLEALEQKFNVKVLMQSGLVKTVSS